MITMNRIMELPRVTRLAKNNNFSKTSMIRHLFQRADNRGCGWYLLSSVAERAGQAWICALLLAASGAAITRII